MKNVRRIVPLLVLSFFPYPGAVAHAADNPALAIIGRGSSPGDGSGNCGGFAGDPSLGHAEQKADGDAASQCASGRAGRTGEYQISYRCGPWNSYLGVSTEAPYECL